MNRLPAPACPVELVGVSGLHEVAAGLVRSVRPGAAGMQKKPVLVKNIPGRYLRTADIHRREILSANRQTKSRGTRNPGWITVGEE